MKQSFIQRIRSFVRLITIVCSVSIIESGCGIPEALQDIASVLNNLGNNTNQILDKAMQDLNGNAENYEQIMQRAMNKIEDQSIKNQLQNALDNAIVTTSTEIKCDIQFTGDYLIKRIKAIKANVNNTTVPIEEPKICTLIPALIEMKLPANQRNSVMITGYFLKEDFSKYRLYLEQRNGQRLDKTNSLTVSSDFKLIINLGSSGITLDNNSNKLVLVWSNNVVTEIPVVQKQLEPCKIWEKTLTGLPQMVIYPEHKPLPWNGNKGDIEFDGHGPCTTGSISIFTRNNNTELWARASIQMWECPDNLGYSQSDYTYGDKTMELKLATVDTGWRIKLIKESMNDSFQNIDRQADRTESFSGSGPVSSYLIQGDMGGDDLGSSRIEVTFKSIKVTLEELGECIRN